MDTYQRLLTAVVETVHEYGYAGATMVRIAGKAGFTRGALQHHFGNRRIDLIISVTRALLAERQAAYETLYSASGQDVVMDSRAAMKAAFRDPRTWFLIEVWIASKGDAELHTAIQRLQSEIEEVSDRALEISARQFTQVNFHVLKALFRSMTRGIALEYARKRDPELFDDVIDVIFDALNALEIELNAA